MDQRELQTLVEHISMESFSKAFRHKATFNGRLRTTGGRYLLQSHNLEFNPKQLEVFGRDAFIKIIKHELVHYHLHLAGKGYRHRDRDFKIWLQKVGGSRFCSALPEAKNKIHVNHHYVCVNCGQSFIRKRKMDISRYVCGKCNGKIKLVHSERN